MLCACGTAVNPERWELGYEYCMSPQCAVEHLQERSKDLRLILMPKQGFVYVSANSPDLLQGKSSGR